MKPTLHKRGCRYNKPGTAWLEPHTLSRASPSISVWFTTVEEFLAAHHLCCHCWTEKDKQILNATIAAEKEKEIQARNQLGPEFLNEALGATGGGSATIRGASGRRLGRSLRSLGKAAGIPPEDLPSLVRQANLGGLTKKVLPQ